MSSCIGTGISRPLPAARKSTVYTAFLWQTIFLESREDSEECVNDTWFSAWNRIPPHRPSALRMFLAKITRGLAFKPVKGQGMPKRRGGGQMPLVLDELGECVAGMDDVAAVVDAKELGRVCPQFVAQLPARGRGRVSPACTSLPSQSRRSRRAMA